MEWANRNRHLGDDRLKVEAVCPFRARLVLGVFGVYSFYITREVDDSRERFMQKGFL
jgi:hypothetical protein